MTKATLKSSTRPVEAAEVPNPVPAEITALNIMLASEKGGVWKSTTAAMIAALVKEICGRLTVFEIDDQEMLVDLFGSDAKKLVLPDDDEARRNAFADVRALEPALTALMTPEAPPVIIDLGAERDKRLARALNMAGIARASADAGRLNIVLVPLFMQSDSVMGAVRTVRRMELALSQARIHICICGSRRERLSEAAQANWKRYLQPQVDKHGLIQLPELEDDLLDEMSKLGCNMAELLAFPITDLAARLDVPAVLATAFVNRVAFHLGTLRQELQQVGVFR